ncbi:MAG TPA: PAS domain S-box protein, partial [Thermoanaerobaculia bacterium]|nr:PAS domain S-box protein [Thermoanaerobaculia bacterium]
MPQRETRREAPTAPPPLPEQPQPEDWHSLILSNASDLISAHSPDATLVFVSGACRRVLGYEPEELLGHPVFEIIHPDDLPAARQVNQRLRGSSGVETFTFRFKRKDQTYVWIEGTVRGLTRPDGDYYVAVMRDVTVNKVNRDEQDKLLRELERAAFEWRSTFDAIQWPLLMLGLDGRLRRINRAGVELLNRQYRDLIGLPVSQIGAGQPWEAVAALTQRVLDTLSPEVCEARDETRTKTWEVDASVSAGSGADDSQVIVQVREITETIRLQESLRHSETMAVLGAVVGGVAHEVRNPLFGM